MLFHFFAEVLSCCPFIFILFLFRNADPVLEPILLAHSHRPNLWHDLWKVVALKHENAGAFLPLHLTIVPFDIYHSFAWIEFV